MSLRNPPLSLSSFLPPFPHFHRNYWEQRTKFGESRSPSFAQYCTTLEVLGTVFLFLSDVMCTNSANIPGC